MQDERVFETERLSVRRWIAADRPRILALYGDEAVARSIGDGRALTPAEARDWMGVTRRNYERRGYGMFAIDDRATGRMIGFGGIVHPGGQPEPEVKYAFSPDVWGRGLATEFVRGLLAHGRAAHGLDRMIATVAAGNAASARVLVKSGFRHEGIRVEEDGSETFLLTSGLLTSGPPGSAAPSPR